MHSNRPETHALPRPEYQAPQTAAQALRRDAEQMLDRVKYTNDAAAALEQINAPATPDGWNMYTNAYGSTVTIDYNAPQDAPWPMIARTIAALRNAYHIPTLKREITGSGEWLSNQYTGRVQLTAYYYPNDVVATIQLRINTGTTLPPTCRIEETRKKVRKTIEVVERKVVCA